MESSKSGNVSVSFGRQMLHNKFLLLTVVLAITVAAFIGVGLFRLIG